MRRSTWLAALMIIPLQSETHWQILKFRNILSNQVKFSPTGLSIKVNNSANPLIYPLPSPKKVTGIHVVGYLDGVLSLESKKQGDRGADDFSVRVGLVGQGEKTLGFFQKLFAPEWVIQLHRLAPPGLGLDRLYFWTAVQQKDLLGKSRTHPLNDVIQETFQWLVPTPGKFDLNVKVAETTTLALWFASDGDDTNSSYTITIETIELEVID